MEPLRYPVTPKFPPLGVRVFVYWNGRIFKAARRHRDQRLCWVADTSAGGDRYLPPKRRKKASRNAERDAAVDAWGDNPECWWPERPDLWKAPLPSPLPPTGITERFVNIRARRRGPSETPADRLIADKAPWWWPGSEDALPIEYAPAGQVTLKMAEGRVMRALTDSGASGMQGQPKRKPDKTFESVAEAALDAEREAELAKESTARRQRFEPGPADNEDWDTAMAWFAALNDPDLRHRSDEPFSLTTEQHVLIWRAKRWSWRDISKQLVRSIRYARDIYDEAIEKVHRAANGRDVHRHRKTRNHIAALQESNRAHHNRQQFHD